MHNIKIYYFIHDLQDGDQIVQFYQDKNDAKLEEQKLFEDGGITSEVRCLTVKIDNMWNVELV